MQSPSLGGKRHCNLGLRIVPPIKSTAHRDGWHQKVAPSVGHGSKPPQSHTPGKINMEPENEPLEDFLLLCLQLSGFQVPCESSRAISLVVHSIGVSCCRPPSVRRHVRPRWCGFEARMRSAPRRTSPASVAQHGT